MKRTLDARGLTTAQWTPLGSASAGDAYSTKTIYDGLGRKTEEWRHLGASQAWSGAWQKVLYAFDDAGRMTTQTVPNTASGTGLQNQVTEFAYDAQGRRTKRCLPDFRQEVSAYLSSGQLNTLTVTSAGANCSTPGTKQIVQTSTWDDAGRRTQLTLTTPATDAAHYGGTKKQTWSWDALDRLEKSTDENAEGTANADDDAIVRYKYDSLGRPLEEGFGESSGAARWKVLSAYDRRGARISLKYPAANGTVGTTLTLTADDLGRLTQIAEGGTSVAVLTHVGAGRLAKIASQDGSLWEGLDWDAAGRRGRGKVTLGGVTQFEEEIAFDDDDRVLSVKWPHLVDSGRPQVQQYTYDEQARLLKVEQGYGTWNGTETKWTFTQYSSFHDFRLDEQGNWAQHQDGAGASLVSPTIAKDNAYTAWPVSGGSPLSFVLDDTGRFVYERPVAGGGKYLYKHDGLGRLVSAQRLSVPGKADLTTSYGYTADGRLAWRKEGAAAREWLIYDGSQAVVQTTDSALSWTHVWAGSRLVRSTKHPAGTVYHPHQDRLGSIVVITRSGGPDRALYDPYGRLVAAFSTITNDTFAVPFGYAGARWEATAGLYQMGARWYDPELGRFLEQDPIGEAGGLNLYAYVGSSPTLWVDPTGLARESSFKGPSSAGSSRKVTMRWEMNGTECSSEQAASYMRMAGRRDEGRAQRAGREAERQAAVAERERAWAYGKSGFDFPRLRKAAATSGAGADFDENGKAKYIGSAPLIPQDNQCRDSGPAARYRDPTYVLVPTGKETKQGFVDVTVYRIDGPYAPMTYESGEAAEADVASQGSPIATIKMSFRAENKPARETRDALVASGEPFDPHGENLDTPPGTFQITPYSIGDKGEAQGWATFNDPGTTPGIGTVYHNGIKRTFLSFHDGSPLGSQGCVTLPKPMGTQFNEWTKSTGSRGSDMWIAVPNAGWAP